MAALIKREDAIVDAKQPRALVPLASVPGQSGGGS